MATATDWEIVGAMIQRRSLTVQEKDRDEYIAFANWWVFKRLSTYLAKSKNPPNVKMLIEWSVGYYFQHLTTPDNVRNLGRETAFLDSRDGPADQAMVLIDTENFIEELNESQATVFKLILRGWKPGEIAHAMNRSAGRISQIRGQIEAKAIECLADYI